MRWSRRQLMLGRRAHPVPPVTANVKPCSRASAAPGCGVHAGWPAGAGGGWRWVYWGGCEAAKLPAVPPPRVLGDGTASADRPDAGISVQGGAMAWSQADRVHSPMMNHGDAWPWAVGRGGSRRRLVRMPTHGRLAVRSVAGRGRRASAGRSARRPRHDDESVPRRETRAAPADEHGPGPRPAQATLAGSVPVASPRPAFPVALAARETGPARHPVRCHWRGPGIDRADAFHDGPGRRELRDRLGLKLVNGPSRPRSMFLVIDHVSLDDPGLLDVGARGPHRDVVSPDDVFLADLGDPAADSAGRSGRRVEREERVIVDGASGPEAYVNENQGKMPTLRKDRS